MPRKKKIKVEKVQHAGLPWTFKEIQIALDPSITTEVLMELTGRTRSSVNKKRWDLARELKHHTAAERCHCLCKKLNGWHCGGGDEHEEFVRQHEDKRQKTLFG